MRTVSARVANGVLEPPDALELDEEREVVLSSDDRPPTDRGGRGIRAADGAWKETYDSQQLKRDIYAARLAKCRSMSITAPHR